ncbi:phosphonate ABC transporter, permease protein PhnE [Brevibacillus brevis]|uniref:Phosphonate ABC transporter, permease protein PhnE n=1 Tax=Brevibacillus brevis TaxID=1393 RepID=A0ABY9T5T5_BREBE|nr:phosphonate ABC transporter, permease protein PhnE [Brevibacillus brevis]WNC15466.1 phosphonate ABC transporter, permease protein PhnE [Brevibacillus brevis]
MKPEQSEAVHKKAALSPGNSFWANWGWVIGTGAVLIVGALVYTLVISWEALMAGDILENMSRIIGEMFPPDLSIIATLGQPIIDTLAMSVMATLLAVCIAFPLGFLAAETTTIHPTVRYLVKGLFNALRTIPELILAIIFVASVGFGILPGILALGLHSAGMLGKFYAEAIDKVDKGLIEAVEACGGSRFHVIVFGVIPQIISHCVDFSLYRWEYNFRASTVVGMIGAGGIGFQLMASLRILQYQEVLAILVAVFVMVQLVDAFGNAIRNKLIVRER